MCFPSYIVGEICLSQNVKDIILRISCTPVPSFIVGEKLVTRLDQIIGALIHLYKSEPICREICCWTLSTNFSYRLVGLHGSKDAKKNPINNVPNARKFWQGQYNNNVNVSIPKDQSRLHE